MNFTDAVRQLLHDPIRLGAARGYPGVTLSVSHAGFLSVLTTGALVWKTEHGQRMEPWATTAQDVLAGDWEVRDMVPSPGRPGEPPPSTLGVERYTKDFRTTMGTPVHPEGRRPLVGGPPQPGGGKGTG